MPHSPRNVRVLLLADSHLGFDLPIHPRVERRRRGHDFMANHERALAAARKENVDLVVHGGDLFHRARVPSSLVFQAFQPLLDLADSGVPVLLVPGNHERSRIPHRRFGSHPNLHIFHEPAAVPVEVRGVQVTLAGFPYQRKGIRDTFHRVLEDTGWRREPADIRLLCIHHCVEGATVGPNDYTFRHAADVIRCSDLPSEFAAVLSGHIHRRQRLDRDLQGRPLATPVLYPGSLERTAYAEMAEPKGFMVLEVEPEGPGGTLVECRSVDLPARSMLVRELRSARGEQVSWRPADLREAVAETLATTAPDAVLRIRIHGPVTPEIRKAVSAPRLRPLIPAEMNVEVILVEDRIRGHVHSRGTRRPSSAQEEPPPQLQGSLFL